MSATTFPGDQEEIDSGAPPRRVPDRLGAVSKILGAILASLLILGIALTGTAWVAAQFVEDDLEALEDALDARMRSVEESFAEQLQRVEDDLDSRINGISDRLVRVETQITSINEAVQEILRRLDQRVAVSVGATSEDAGQAPEPSPASGAMSSGQLHKGWSMTLESNYHDRCQRLAGDLRVLLGAPRSRFGRMLEEHGAVEATRRLIHRREPSSTFRLLWEKQRLDLTVEAVIVTEHEWDPLFDDADRDAARQRLRDFHWPTAPAP